MRLLGFASNSRIAEFENLGMAIDVGAHER
jgi:hypothetical protein